MANLWAHTALAQQIRMGTKSHLKADVANEQLCFWLDTTNGSQTIRGYE